MKQSDSLKNLATALVAAQAEIRAVAKDSTNPDFRSKYASLDTIIEHVRPVLAKHALAVIQGGTTPDTNEHGAVTGFAVETMLVHASGEFITNTAVMPVIGRMLKGGEIGPVTPQSAGSALSYGRRYGLAALLCLATEEDDDGNAASRPAAVTVGGSVPARPTSNGGASAPPASASSPAPAGGVTSAARGAASETARAGGHGDDPTCPKCDGPLWDNRVGKKNPKAPDWKCRDKACDGVIWPPRDKPSAVPFRPGDEAPHPADLEEIPF